MPIRLFLLLSMPPYICPNKRVMGAKKGIAIGAAVLAVGGGAYLYWKMRAAANSLDSIRFRYADLNSIKFSGKGLGGEITFKLKLAVNNASRVAIKLRLRNVSLMDSSGSAVAQSIANNDPAKEIAAGTQDTFTIPLEMPIMDIATFLLSGLSGTQQQALYESLKQGAAAGIDISSIEIGNIWDTVKEAGKEVVNDLINPKKDEGKQGIVQRLTAKIKAMQVSYDADVNGMPVSGKLALGEEKQPEPDGKKVSGLSLSAGPRNVSDGSRFNSMIGSPDSAGNRIMRADNVDNTAANVMDMVRLKCHEAKRLYDMLWEQAAGNKFEYCRRVFDFCYKFLQYRNDRSGSEQLNSPAQAWHEGQVLHKQQGVNSSGIDCDDFTIFVCSLLRCAGIPYRSRIAGYNKHTGYQHIYAVARVDGRDVVIDPVVDKFNWEKPPLRPFKRDFDENGLIV